MKRMILGSTVSAAVTLLLLGGGTASAASTVHAADTGASCPVAFGNDNGTPVLLPSTLTSASGATTWDPTASAASASQLAFTGTDAAGLGLVGGGLLAGGLLLVRASRMRQPEAD